MVSNAHIFAKCLPHRSPMYLSCWSREY